MGRVERREARLLVSAYTRSSIDQVRRCFSLNPRDGRLLCMLKIVGGCRNKIEMCDMGPFIFCKALGGHINNLLDMTLQPVQLLWAIK